MNKITVRICGSSGGGKISDLYPVLLRGERRISYSDGADADFLFVTHRPTSVREMFSIPDRGQIRVFVGLEAQSPDMNLFDYAITFDQAPGNDRIFRPHTLVTFERFLEDGTLNFGQKVPIQSFLDREGFCDFIYGNKEAHPTRDKIFHELNERFQQVSSYGTHLRTARFSDLKIARGPAPLGWHKEKIEAQRRHKFSIAAENARFEGYTSEKLLTPLMAGSIPIYWGNPEVGKEFNLNRFINFSGEGFDELEEEVTNLLDSPDLLEKMLREPALTGEQLQGLEKSRRRIVSWFEMFFDGDLASLRRRPRGWYPDWYSGMMRSAYKRQRFSRARLAGAWRGIRADYRS